MLTIDAPRLAVLVSVVGRYPSLRAGATLADTAAKAGGTRNRADVGFRGRHTPSSLPPSGRVLVAGGCTPPGCDDVEGYTATAEIYDPRSRRPPTASMSRMRNNAYAFTLPSGDVLLAGGYSGRLPTASAELYDEESGTFRPAQSLLEPRAGGTATRLRDGRILFAGGETGTQVLASAEIYDPATGQFSPTGSMAAPRRITQRPPPRRPSAGRGRRDCRARVVRTAEVYDPGSGTFSATGSSHGSATSTGRRCCRTGAS